MAAVMERVVSASSFSRRFTFAGATSRPGCVAGGGVFLRSLRFRALAHCSVRGRGTHSQASASRLPRSPSLSAVLVPAVAHGCVGRIALAVAVRFGRGVAAASALAGAVVPSVAPAPASLSARSQEPQPNPAVNRTCAKSRAGRLLLR